MKRMLSIVLLSFTSLVSAQIVFDTLDGRHISLASLANKQIVINYWADWCDPCVKEIKSLNDFYHTYRQSVALFAVNYDQPSLSSQRKAAHSHHIKYPSLATNPAKMLALGDINVVPATFILNPDGKVVKTLYGPQTAESLSKELTLAKSD